MPGAQGKSMVTRVFNKVEAGHLDQVDPWVEVGVGLSGDYIHAVARIDQCLAQVLDVNTLAASIGMAAIAQQADAERASSKSLGDIHKRGCLFDQKGSYSTGLTNLCQMPVDAGCSLESLCYHAAPWRVSLVPRKLTCYLQKYCLCRP